MIVDFSCSIVGEAVETEDCEGLKFVITGNFNHYKSHDEIIEIIKDKGGFVTDHVSKNTDYLVCGDIHAVSSEMNKAKVLGIAVLSEVAFIIRFCTIDEYDGIQEINYGDACNLTVYGNVLDFVAENGTQPIYMEIWKDGRWQRNESPQKSAIKMTGEFTER